MRITILGPAHPYRGGISALNERLAKQLVDENHDVNVISFTLQYPGFLFPGKTQFSDTKEKFPFPITREINSIYPINWFLVGQRIKKAKPDLVIVRFWLPFMGMALGTVCREIRKNKHTKVVALTDNLIPHEKRPGDKFLIRYFVNSVDGFVAMSESVLKDIGKFNQDKPRKLTPHPIYDHYGEVESREKALEKLKLSSEYRYILFFGFIRDYKGLDLLLKAIVDDFFTKNKIKLVIAGEFYTDDTPYLTLIEDLNLHEQVILKTNYIPNTEVQHYFNAADIVVQPYKTATQSGVTQIGYHFNKPMLVTDVGGLAEIIPHMKVGYVVPTIPEEISEALKDFYENNRVKTFEENIMVEKKRFGWDKMTKTLYTIFKDLTNE